MYRHQLTTVPKDILSQPANIQKGMTWQIDYNVAAWFRFKELTNNIVKLHIHWQDDNGEHTILIDQTVLNTHSVLLSGIARLKALGRIQSMSVAIETSNLSYSVDELFIQPVKTKPEVQQKALRSLL